MTHKIRYIMVGGFLGAGKTTMLGRLAGYYAGQGLKVGVVTNDQAADLVDTKALRALGLDVGEVAGACFCCHFNELISTMDRLGAGARPDVILAEPVGSCTDLAATVLQPLKHLFGARFSIAPYSVILKPSHGQRILANQRHAGFSPKAAYIFKKQLEEADAVLINRIDELSPEEINELERLVQEQDLGVPVLRVSARTGEGFDRFTELLAQEGDFGRRLLDIDYDTYAEGEAELGWLNSSARITALSEFSLDELLLEIITRLRGEFESARAETAHLKTIGLWEGFFGVANLVSSDSEPELSLPSNSNVCKVDLIVNARVACEPAFLEERVKSVMVAASRTRGAELTFNQSQSFRPGRPVPTHRYETAH